MDIIDRIAEWASKSNARYYFALTLIFLFLGSVLGGMLIGAWQILAPAAWRL